MQEKFMMQILQLIGQQEAAHGEVRGAGHRERLAGADAQPEDHVQPAAAVPQGVPGEVLDVR